MSMHVCTPRAEPGFSPAGQPGPARPGLDITQADTAGPDARFSRRGFGLTALATAAGMAMPLRAQAFLPTTVADLMMPNGQVWPGWTPNTFVTSLKTIMPLLEESLTELHRSIWPTGTFAQWWSPILTRFNVAIGVDIVKWTSATKPTINFSGTVVAILQSAMRAWLSVACEQMARRAVKGKVSAELEATAGSIVASAIMLSWQFSISKILGQLFTQGEAGRRKLLAAPGELGSLITEATQIDLTVQYWREIGLPGYQFATLTALSRQGRSATVRGNMGWFDQFGVHHVIADPGLVYAYTDGSTSRIVSSTVLDPAYPYRP